MLYISGKHYLMLLFVMHARVLLKCFKSHTGYYGCDRCTQKGRAQERWAIWKYQQPQLSAPPLNELGMGWVTSFVLHYMHLVCLGAMYKLKLLWLKGWLKCRQSICCNLLNLWYLSGNIYQAILQGNHNPCLNSAHGKAQSFGIFFTLQWPCCSPW